jgi:outer membrane protein OmpA-like peptidoglycan-associated protein
MNKLLLTFLLFIYVNIFAQQTSSDCHTAVVMLDSVYKTGAVLNFGNTKEFNGNPLKHPYLFPSEEQSVWYKIPVNVNGTFTFDLIPDDSNDDWDFLVFVSEKGADCSSVLKTKPIRSNISRVNKTNSGQTGLSQKAKKQFVPSGIGDDYSTSIQVKENQQIIIVTNNWSKSGRGHTLKINMPSSKEIINKEFVKEEFVKENKTEVSEKYAEVIIRVFLPDKKTPLIANLNIVGLSTRKDTTIAASEFRFSVKPYETFTINASVKGFMFESRSVTAGKQGSKEIVQIILAPLKEGEKVNLSNIQFYGNAATFLPSSKPSLYALLNFLQENENAMVEIQGHVNGPNSNNTNEFKKLSENRAEAVKSFLIENGISEKRLKANGYGNSKMLYPNPVTEGQHAANRRVEIVILKLK